MRSDSVFPADTRARAGALLVARPELSTLTVTGPDRLEWLQGILTCDVAGLAPGDGRWGLVLSRQGKILSDVLVVAGADSVHLGVPAAAAPRVLAWLSSFLVMEDADIADRSAAFTWFLAHGPRGGELVAHLAGSLGGIGGAVDPTGLGGAALLVPPAQAAAAEALAATVSFAEVATAEDWTRLRVERKVPLFGIDIDEQRNPHEAGLDRRCVSWEKGCYLGQEAVCMLDMRGKVKRRLVLLVVPGPGVPPPPGTPVLNDQLVAVGETRTAARSALFDGIAVLSLVAESSTPPGTRLALGHSSGGEVTGPPAPAAVVEANR